MENLLIFLLICAIPIYYCFYRMGRALAGANEPTGTANSADAPRTERANDGHDDPPGWETWKARTGLDHIPHSCTSADYYLTVGIDRPKD